MEDFSEYLRQSEPHKQNRASSWRTAIGLQDVDGLAPSEYLIDTARRNIEGEISINEVREMLADYYHTLDNRADMQRTEEADKVSLHIVELLNDKTFSFSVAGFSAIHRKLFGGVMKTAGEFRTYNITKNEWVLRGDTVMYTSYDMIRDTLEYDFSQEKAFDYRRLSMKEIVRHLCAFVAGVWQIHPFCEGNTRTTAIFTIKYLQQLGFDVNNDVFAENSWYFRNALVRANYNNVKFSVFSTTEFLEKIFGNMLMGELNELKNRYMLIGSSFDSERDEHKCVPYSKARPKKKPTSTPSSTPTSTPTSTPSSTPTSTPTSSADKWQTDNENILRLIGAIGNEKMSVREMLSAVGLKNRENFLEYSLNPALKGKFVKMLYPDRPTHPRQKYFLTVKGLAVFGSLNGNCESR